MNNQKGEEVEPERPLISCLMVSRGDVFPAQLAIHCYRKQTYPNRELVIVSANGLQAMQDQRQYVNASGKIMETVSGQRFGAETLKMDGVHFTNCAFSDTTLRYLGGTVPIFEGCTMSGVKFQFDGTASNTYELLKQLVALGVVKGI